MSEASYKEFSIGPKLQITQAQMNSRDMNVLKMYNYTMY